MYPPKFDYYRADSVEKAIALLREHGGAKLLAGGRSLLPAMKIRLSDPGTLIDIGRIAALKGISVEDGAVRIGALTPHASVAKSSEVPAALSQAAGLIGDPMVRNRGTVGGNIAHADPASDLPTVFVALGATMLMTGQEGSREVPAEEFFTGFFETDLGEDEILTAVRCPAEGAGTGSAYAKLMNPASRYAIVGAAAQLTVENGTCTKARIAVGGLTPVATRASSVEAALAGNALTDDVIDAAAAAVDGDLGDDILGDIHASSAYRREMIQVYVGKALRQAAERAG